MARSHGKNAVFSLDDSGGTLRLISPHCNQISGLPGAARTSDATPFGAGGDRSIRGLEGMTFTVNGFIDDTATTGSITVLNGNRTKTTTSTFEYGPEGSASGKVKYSGECWMEGLTIDASVQDTVPFSATFKLDDVITVGTY